MRQQVTNSLARAAALAGLFALVLTAVGQLFGTWWWLCELACHFTPYYALALLVAVPVLWLHPEQRRPMLAGLCITALVWNVALLWPSWRPEIIKPIPPDVTVLSLNVHTYNRQHDAVLELIEQHDPDVLMLYEVNQRWIDALAQLAEQYPTKVLKPRTDNFGIAVYTRMQVELAEVLDFGADVPSVELGANVNGNPVAMLATHPLPPIGSEYAVARDRQLSAIAAWARVRDMPTLVAGDLNITPWSPYFRRLLTDGGLRDSSRGQGINSTWRPIRWLPGIPIDHVLLSGGWQLTGHDVGPDVGSDHRPVVVNLWLPSG